MLPIQSKEQTQQQIQEEFIVRGTNPTYHSRWYITEELTIPITLDGISQRN